MIKRPGRWLTLAMVVLFPAVSRADLDEQGFEKYENGELLGQKAWLPQGPSESGKYTNQKSRAEVRAEAGKEGKWIAWLSGFSAKEQSRLIKSFDKTNTDKVRVTFSFLPGSNTVPGRMYFNESGVGGMSIHFAKGNLILDGAPQADGSTTSLPFEAQDWNQVELQFDFKAHLVRGFVNGKGGDAVAISPNLAALNQVNIFAGGETFESGMDSLAILSVSEFPHSNTDSAAQ